MLTTDEIKRFIDEDISSVKKRLAGVGQRYYEGEHDILQCRLFYFDADGKLQEDRTRSNFRISHPYFRILIDQLSPYMLSFEEHPIRAKDAATGLQGFLDEYFDDDFWSEIGDLIDGAGIKGFEYLYGYRDEGNRLSFECADAMGVVEVQGRYSRDGRDYKIYHYADTDLSERGKCRVRRIQVWSDTEIYHYIQSNEGDIKLDKRVQNNPRPHVIFEDGTSGGSLGYIPFWRLDNNKKQFSALKPIKPLIDDCDLMQSGLSNSITDFDTPLHVVRGYQGDNLDELQQNIKTKKIIGVDDGGDVEIRTVDIPYAARQAKAAEDEKNIYVFGMGFNPSQVGDGNITNVVIKSRYTLLDMRAEKLEKRLKKLLQKIVRIVIDEINAEHGTGYQYSDVKIERFQKNTPTNETENSQTEKTNAETKQIEINTILNVAAELDNETVARLICETLDIDYDEIKSKLPTEEAQSPADARALLAGVETEEETTEDITAQPTE